MGATLPGRIVVDAGALAPNAGTLDAPRAASARGAAARPRDAPAQRAAELLELIAFCGLAEVLRVEPRREAEEREQRLGVEEERELDDPPAL